MSLNYNETTGTAKEPLDWGLLECSNCYAKMDTLLRFQLIGEGFEISHVALSLDAKLDFNMQIKALNKSKQLVGKGWTEIDKILGEDLLNGITDALQIPFFNKWNENTVQLELRPTFSMSTWVEVKKDIGNLVGDVMDSELKAFLNTNGKPVTWKAFWDKKDGFGVTVPTSDDIKYDVSFGGWSYPDGLLTKLKQCFGVDLRAFGKSMTSVSMCPEQENIIWEGSLKNIPAEFLKTHVLPDSDLCMDIKKFDTNMDKKKLFPDTVEGKVCFQGKCVGTSPEQFEASSSIVNFNDGLLCIPVRRSWVESSGVFLHAFEQTLLPGWNQYTTPLEVSLPERCPSLKDCLLELDLPAPDTTCPWDNKPCYAKLTVSFSLTEKSRRLDSVEGVSERLLEGTQSYTCTTYGMSSEFSGVKYGLGDGFNVVDPVRAETSKPQEPKCAPVHTSMIDGASREQRGMLFILGVFCMSMFSY